MKLVNFTEYNFKILCKAVVNELYIKKLVQNENTLSEINWDFNILYLQLTNNQSIKLYPWYYVK